jgi:hypothetical protein
LFKQSSISSQAEMSSAANVETVQVQQQNRNYHTKNFQPISIQKKLSVGSVDDPLEHEADNMADKVMRMPEQNFVQRKCAACEEEERAQRKPLETFIQKKCAHCEEEERAQRKPSASFIQKKATENNTTVNDSISNQIQSTKGSGNAMSGSTKSFMENRFGADFSNVKIHTGNYAAQLSKDLNAQAFTVGNDIYFNEGKYQPESSEGKHLLAHELTHTLQQSSAVQYEKIQRQSNTQVTVTVSNAPGTCSLNQHHQIEPAVYQVQRWLSRAIQHVNNYTGNAASEPGVSAALQYHFHSTTAQTASNVLTILNRISSEIITRPDLNVECHTAADGSCGSAGAYVSGNLLAFCPDFFQGDATWQATALLHELAHSITGVTRITDRAYRRNRAYTYLSTNEALTNAESYALFCKEIAEGTTQRSTATQDDFNDCGDRQRVPARRSIAQLERWNRNAQTLTNDSRPGMLSQWQDLQTRYLGGASAASIRRAKNVYDKVYSRLGSSITFECERRCDSGVEGYYRYFLFITSNTLHLCPVIFSLNEDERTHSIYTLILVRYGEVSNNDAINYSRLARELNNRFWAPPTTLSGF